MKSISEIEFGFSDAENYRRRENKDCSTKSFLEQACSMRYPARMCFSWSAKRGAGKTAYAVCYSNAQYKSILSNHKLIKETDYLKFTTLKRDNKLTLSYYTDIWKVIIYLLMANSVYSQINMVTFLKKFLQFLYDQNIISYVEDAEGERFIRWCFIERTPSNIAPKVKTNSDYEIHYGLANVLNIGKEIKAKGRNVLANVDRYRSQPGNSNLQIRQRIGESSRASALPHKGVHPSVENLAARKQSSAIPRPLMMFGKIKIFDAARGFGLITVDGSKPIVFRRSSLGGKFKPIKGLAVTFRLSDADEQRPLAIDVMPAN